MDFSTFPMAVPTEAVYSWRSFAINWRVSIPSDCAALRELCIFNGYVNVMAIDEMFCEHLTFCTVFSFLTFYELLASWHPIFKCNFIWDFSAFFVISSTQTCAMWLLILLNVVSVAVILGCKIFVYNLLNNPTLFWFPCRQWRMYYIILYIIIIPVNTLYKWGGLGFLFIPV